MRKLRHYDSAAEWYTAILKNGRKSKLPPGYPQPQPPALWPAENVALLERYLVWLYADNAGPTSIHHYYLPTAGHVLGYHLEHHSTIDLDAGLARVLAYFQAKQLCDRWRDMGRHALTRFRRFMHEERGYARLPAFFEPTKRIKRYHAGLPAWLVDELRQYQHIRQQNWRPARLEDALINFWSSHTRLWRWLFAQYEIATVGDVKRSHLYAYLDDRLAGGYSVRGVNLELRAFQSTLRFLQERDYEVPQALLRQSGLRAPESLPRFLTDEQVGLLQAELERCVQDATPTPARQRNALLDRAIFYLLWQGGLRGSEVEDLERASLNLRQRQLVIRGGKGQKDRTVYLTERACSVVQAYLAVRGSGASDHVFLYRHEPLGRELVRNRIKAAGKRAGVKVTPHQLRHTYATQLVNAGCRITTIQALMGHKRLSTTLVYTQIHNRTVADDYYAAMAKVEKTLEHQLPQPATAPPAENGHAPNPSTAAAHLLTLAAALQTDLLPEKQQSLVMALREGLSALAKPVNEKTTIQVPQVQQLLNLSLGNDPAASWVVVNEQQPHLQVPGHPP